MASTDFREVTLDFPSIAAGAVAVLDVDLSPIFGGGYIKPPFAVIPCYPENAPNNISIEARIIAADSMRVGVRNNTGSAFNPPSTTIGFIFLGP